MIRYALALALLAVLAAGGTAWLEAGRAARLSRALDESEAEILRWQAEATAAARALEQARLARRVAEAEAARQRRRAGEYDALRATLAEGDDDAPLPDWFRDYLDRLLRPGAAAAAPDADRRP